MSLHNSSLAQKKPGKTAGVWSDNQNKSERFKSHRRDQQDATV